MELYSRNSQLETSDGQKFCLKGLSWFGSESNISTQHGLWAQPLSFFINFIRDNNFNFVRIPFSTQFALDPDSIQAGGIDYKINPDLKEMSAGKVLDHIIQELGRHGILVLLDMHVFTPGAPIEDLWYNTQHDEDEIIKAWQNLVRRCRTYPIQNVVACDINNEPHGSACWGIGEASKDWCMAAQRIGNAILDINPHLCIFVEGVEKNVCVQTSRNSWWGGCLAGVQTIGVKLNVPDKLVYSPHCYGPDVFMVPYFEKLQNKDFHQLRKIWDEDFGFIKNQNLGPAVCIGEFGGKAVEGSIDKIWQEGFVNYQLEKGLTDNFYWSLNPNSGDTQGLLYDDWSTQNTWKLNLLQKMQPQPTKINPLILNVPTELQNNVEQREIDVTNLKGNNDRSCSIQNETESRNQSQQFINQSVIEQKIKNSWKSNEITSYEVEFLIINNSNNSLKDYKMLIAPASSIQQIWNADLIEDFQSHRTYKLPTWLVENGGIKAYQSHTFGGIFNYQVPKVQPINLGLSKLDPKISQIGSDLVPVAQCQTQQNQQPIKQSQDIKASQQAHSCSQNNEFIQNYHGSTTQNLNNNQISNAAHHCTSQSDIKSQQQDIQESQYENSDNQETLIEQFQSQQLQDNLSQYNDNQHQASHENYPLV